jgi:hemolysin activation/secretion protein
LSLRYSGYADYFWGNGGFFAEYAHNLHGGSDNDAAAYAASRAGAGTNWQVLRYGADLNYEVSKGWNFVGRLRGQWTNEPLIAGEQFGLGGVYSVRGFLERETAGDTGYALNLELWSPPLAQDLRLLAFVDTGRRTFDVAVAGQPNALNVTSIGAGMRWNWQRHLDVALDVAYVLDGIPGGTVAGDARTHFGAVYRF